MDLGRVGIPSAGSDTTLLTTLVGAGFVPVVACIGVAGDGRLLNVNADTLAGHLAARLGASRLTIAGTTARCAARRRLDGAAARCGGDPANWSAAERRPRGWSRNCGRANRRSRPGWAMCSLSTAAMARRWTRRRAAWFRRAPRESCQRWHQRDDYGDGDSDEPINRRDSRARSAARSADLQARADHVRARTGRAAVRRRGARISRSAVGDRCGVARPRAPRVGAGDCRAGAGR